MNDQTEYNRCQIPTLDVTNKQTPRTAQAEEERQEEERQRVRERQLEEETESRKKRDRGRAQRTETERQPISERPVKRAKRIAEIRDIRYYGPRQCQ